MTTLASRGFKQGSIVCCSALESDLQELIQDSRALKKYRTKPIVWKGCSDNRLIVLTQDCDLHHGNYIELIFSKPISKSDPRKEHTRNVEVLHLRDDAGVWELDVNTISVIEKEVLESYDSFQPSGCLEPDSLDMCKTMRIRRYNRIPFPDDFERYFFVDYVRDRKSGFEDFLFENRQSITEIYAQVSDTPNDRGKLSVSFTALISDDTSVHKESEIQIELLKHLEALEAQGNLSMMQLQGSEPSDGELELANRQLTARPEDMTLADIQVMRQLRLDAYCWPSDSSAVDE